MQEREKKWIGETSRYTKITINEAKDQNYLTLECSTQCNSGWSRSPYKSEQSNICISKNTNLKTNIKAKKKNDVSQT